MQDMLADLREAQPVSSITSKKPLQTSGTTERKQARSLLLANAEKGSGGINTSNFSRDTGGSELAARQTVEVTSSIEALEAVEESSTGGGSGGAPGGRSLDEITRVMNANKNAVFNIYQRALRKNPLLRGTVVFRMTIAPDGSMTACEIVSSDLNDKRLERKLVLRVKRINFGAKNVEEITVNFPIEFLPP
ncbi:MAG TPA: TonB family protein [Candidatus Tenderia sp.]|nr:TonB family protein [Candidatus Tenderia sp.]